MDADRQIEAEQLLAAGRAVDAIALMKNGMEEEAADAETHYLFGKAHFQMRNLPAAEAEIRKAIALDPSRAEAVYYLGLIAERKGGTDDALRHYRASLALNPRLEKAREKSTS